MLKKIFKNKSKKFKKFRLYALYTIFITIWAIVLLVLLNKYFNIFAAFSKEPTYDIRDEISRQRALARIKSIQSKYGINDISGFYPPEIELIIRFKIGPFYDLDKINQALDSQFNTLCKNQDLMGWEDANFYAKPACSFEFVHHYAKSKIALGNIIELSNNEAFIKLLEATYKNYKELYSSKQYMEPKDNRWSHTIEIAALFDLVDKNSRDKIIRRWATVKFNESLPMLAQAWNRWWVFSSFRVNNVEDLRNMDSLDFEEAKNVICSYTPEFERLRKEDIFNEGSSIMLNKYVKIMNFCNKKVAIKELA